MVRHAVRLTKIVDADEVRVVEARHGFGFGFEGRAENRVVAELAREDFDRYRAIERDLPSKVDGAHAALGDKLLELIGREQRSQLLNRWGLGCVRVGSWFHGIRENILQKAGAPSTHMMT
jgi:hypothetical protein